MKLLKALIFTFSIVLGTGSVWGQSRSGTVVKSTAGSTAQAKYQQAGFYRHGGCDSCESSMDSCGGCRDSCCNACCPRILPAIAGSIHAVADHVADTLSCVFPCYHRRWSSCQSLWDGCCPQSCCHNLWTPSYRDCGGKCGGMQVPNEVLDDQTVPTPVPDKAQGARTFRKSPAVLPSSTQWARPNESRRSATVSVQKKSTPTLATPRALAIDDDDADELPVNQPVSVAKKTVRRTSNETPTVRLAPANPLR